MLEPICQSIEVIMTKGLLTECNEPSKQIKIMKRFVLPNRQAAVPPETHLVGWLVWGGKNLEIAWGSTNMAFQQLARGCPEHGKTSTLPTYLGFTFAFNFPGPGPVTTL